MDDYNTARSTAPYTDRKMLNQNEIKIEGLDEYQNTPKQRKTVRFEMNDDKINLKRASNDCIDCLIKSSCLTKFMDKKPYSQ
jgi:hypothetical protein